MELVRQKAYRKTLEIACSEIRGLSLEEQLHNAGLSNYRKEDEGFRVLVPFFDDIVELATPACTFKSMRGSNMTLTSRIVILHYLLHASGTGLGSELTAYQDIPGCRSYAPVFETRVTKPLVRAFGYARDAFMQAGISLGGEEEDYGNASFTLHVFPRVPLTFILWEGDQDFPPSVKVLFDRTVNTYLPAEDIVVVAKMASTRIIGKAYRDHAEEYA